MSKEQSNNETSATQKQAMSKEDRSSLVLGIVAVLIVVGIFCLLLAAMTNGKRIQGEFALADDGEVLRRGTEQTLVFDRDNDYEVGTPVTWYVNGEEVAQTEVGEDGKITLGYTPEACGQMYVQARIGTKYTTSGTMYVEAPKLTFTAPNYTVTYGDKLPDMYKYDCCGFVDDDCAEMLCYDGKCTMTDCDDNVCTDCNGKLAVGTYKLRLPQNCEYKDYETEYVDGTLTVLPRKVTVAEIVKEYDQTDIVNANQIRLSGVNNGDDVHISYASAKFDCTDAGTCKVNLQQAKLTGKDSANYTLDATSVRGHILPRRLHLVGMSVCDKTYDGTTKAEVCKPGKLVGVLDGDSVAIGSMVAKFADANVQNGKKVTVTDIKLVGYDKDNYVIVEIDQPTANITSIK